MKNVFTLIIGLLCTSLKLFAQDQLDYTGYRIVFRDDFRYPDPSDIYPSTSFQSDNTFNAKWDLGLPYPCLGWGHERYEKGNVTMPKNGIIRLTITNNTDTSCNNPAARNFGQLPVNHISGMLASKQQVNLGIIEARIKLPAGRGDSAAWPAFWMPWSDEATNYTEIDIIDNAASNDSDIVSNIFFVLKRGTNLVRYTGRTNKPAHQLLSDEYHVYSCVWEPSKVSFYVDGKYLHHMNYTDGQTYPHPHTVLLTLQTRDHTKSGLTMDIDWVKYWEKDSDGSLDIAQATTLSPTLHKHQTIQLSTKKKRKTITVDKESATILEAKSVTISKNFIADESEPTTKPVVLRDFSKVTAPSNGYLLIRPTIDKMTK